MNDTQKLEFAKKSLWQVAQAYHMLANIVNSDRHMMKNWSSCQEATCIGLRNSLALAEIEIKDDF